MNPMYFNLTIVCLAYLTPVVFFAAVILTLAAPEDE